MNDALFQEMKESMEEALEYAKGNSSRVRVRRVEIKEVKNFETEEIKDIRKNLNLTQRTFADLVGVSPKTIEAWESGHNKPSGAARRVLEIYSEHPEMVENEVIEEEDPKPTVSS